MPGAAPVRPPTIEPPEPRVVDGGYRPPAPAMGGHDEPMPTDAPDTPGAATRPSTPTGSVGGLEADPEVIEPVGPATPIGAVGASDASPPDPTSATASLDAAVPVRPGRGADVAHELASTRFSPAATWPSAPDAEHGRPPSLFSASAPGEVIDLRDGVEPTPASSGEQVGDSRPETDGRVADDKTRAADADASADDRSAVAPGDTTRS